MIFFHTELLNNHISYHLLFKSIISSQGSSFSKVKGLLSIETPCVLSREIFHEIFIFQYGFFKDCFLQKKFYYRKSFKDLFSTEDLKYKALLGFILLKTIQRCLLSIDGHSNTFFPQVRSSLYREIYQSFFFYRTHLKCHILQKTPNILLFYRISFKDGFIWKNFRKSSFRRTL